MLVSLKKNIKSKKGLSSIEMVIGSFVIISLFAVMTDFIRMSSKMQSLSSTINYVSKVLSNQGCITPTNPENIYLSSSGNKLYSMDYIKNKKFITSGELLNTINNIMLSDGIEPDEWRVYIDGVELTSGYTSELYDFRERIPVRVEIDYTWETIGNILPIDNNELSQTLNSSQEIVSIYKVRDLDINEGFEYGEN